MKYLARNILNFWYPFWSKILKWSLFFRILYLNFFKLTDRFTKNLWNWTDFSDFFQNSTSFHKKSTGFSIHSATSAQVFLSDRVPPHCCCASLWIIFLRQRKLLSTAANLSTGSVILLMSSSGVMGSFGIRGKRYVSRSAAATTQMITQDADWMSESEVHVQWKIASKEA